jgi:hypothetical protein
MQEGIVPTLQAALTGPNGMAKNKFKNNKKIITKI